VKRGFRGEFRQRVLVEASNTNVLSRATDVASSQRLLAAYSKERERKLISGAQRRRRPDDGLWG
jgi:hypothetical protein